MDIIYILFPYHLLKEFLINDWRIVIRHTLSQDQLYISN
jgi:hypothetical protein